MSLQYLRGVGPERFRILQRLGLNTLEDMMYLFPRRYEDRSVVVSVAEIKDEEKQLIEGKIVQKKLIYTRRGPNLFRLIVDDGTGRCAGIWFNSAYLDKTFEVGQTVVFYGRAEKTGGAHQMVHPDYEILDSSTGRRIHTGRVVPIYPSTQDLPPRTIRTLQYELLIRYLRDLVDPLPSSIRNGLNFVNKLFAMKSIHFPASLEDLDKAYRRLVFEEFFLIQLALALKKKKAQEGVVLPNVVEIGMGVFDEFRDLLPFQLTAGQEQAIQDVVRDLMKPAPMHRLIQGDVGSGKTTVAAFALYATVRAGHQGALMAPTEILAQQHYFTISRLLSSAGIQVGLLTQGQSIAEREQVLERLAKGDYRIVCGTHALIQDRVFFEDLQLAVVDEQHKFGVLQRKFLQDKSKRANLLVMTATPIPRTLAMTLYGDLDLSVVDDMPGGRGCVQTAWVGEDKREVVYQLLDEELSKGRQAFIVHPLVERSENLTLKNATQSMRDIQERFKNRRVGLLHGQMKSEEKHRVMNEFKNNASHILVSTSVIEVGIDVPNATVLIVENAERFGLSQLHQLRGRIGRSEHDAVCILFSDSDHPAAVARLQAFSNLASGFDVAEEDLKLRGPGDLLGLRQHGIPTLRIGDLLKDVSLLETARREAFELVRRDPSLTKPEHRVLKEEVSSRFRKLTLSG